MNLEASSLVDRLAFKYVKTMSRKKPYQLQSIAIKNFLANQDNKRFIEDLNLDPKSFFDKYHSTLVKDLMFKNYSFEVRNMKLISPAHYFYYTKLVFELVLSNNDKIKSYEMERTDGFYSGLLCNNINQFKNTYSIYNHSYKSFLEKLSYYVDHEILYIDFSDFFDSISIKKLVEILKMYYKDSFVIPLEEFFSKLNIDRLPQFHNSIASSLLSQEYLRLFDTEIQKILLDNNIRVVRFVDDMYFINEKPSPKKGEKFYYQLLDQMSRIAWKHHLSINGSKVKVYSDETVFKLDMVNKTSTFVVEERIEERAKMISQEEFLSFVEETDNLYRENGFNFKSFKKGFDQTFSIKGEDGQKVLNNFIYGGKWRKFELFALKKILSNYRFAFFLPNPLLILYLKIYDYVEDQDKRDGTYIKSLVSELDKGANSSIMLLDASINYLIQRGFK